MLLIIEPQMNKEFTRDATQYIPEPLLKMFANMPVLEPEVPGRVLASLALRAPQELSGKYLHWDDASLSSL